MMARRGEAVWQAPHNEPQHSQCALLALPKGAPRRTDRGMPSALRVAFPWPQRHLPLLRAGRWANATCSEVP